MGGLSLQRRIAASILKVGESRIIMDPEHLEEIKNAITRADVKKMISHGYIKVKAEKVKKPKLGRKKKKGAGRKKGAAGTRGKGKKRWINSVRPLRKMLKEFRDKGIIDVSTYRKAYSLVKAGMFRSRSHLELYLKQKGGRSESRRKV